MGSDIEASLQRLLTEVRACCVCAGALPLEPRPVIRCAASARLLIVGQAPGIRVHETGIPWNDPSGDRLRAWMDVDRETFYNESRIAIIPMSYCYPGRGPRGDNPPRKECAELWFPRLLAHLPKVRLTLLVGRYAQRHFLRDGAKRTLTETVRAWRDYLPEFIPLPHPSARNQYWLEKNPWFGAEVVPALRENIDKILRAGRRS